MADENEVKEVTKERFLEAVDTATGNLRPQAEPKPAEDKVETPVETKPAAETVPVTVEKVEPTTPVETKETTTETVVPQSDWKELIKKVDRKEVLKAAGLDDFELDFITHRANGVDPYKYLEVKGRDWTKIDDAEVLRRDLKAQYPDLDPESFEILAKRKIDRRFGLDDELLDESEKKANQIEMKIEADKLRAKFKEEDDRFLIPEKTFRDEQAEQLALVEKQKEEFLAFVSENDATKHLLTSKQITAEEGMNFPADPAAILNFVQNPDKFFTLFHKPVTDESGKVVDTVMDMDLMYRAINYALNRPAFEKALIDYGKSLGTKAGEDEIHAIPKEKTPEGVQEKQMSLNERFMKEGREVPL